MNFLAVMLYCTAAPPLVLTTVVTAGEEEPKGGIIAMNVVVSAGLKVLAMGVSRWPVSNDETHVVATMLPLILCCG